MHCLKKDEMEKIGRYFEDSEETLIWSCLQGYMGKAWTNDIKHPRSAQVITGDFCFFAGDPDRELVRNIPEDFPSNCILMVPQNREWADVIEQEYKENAVGFMRYAIKKEPEVFNTAMLRAYIDKLPAGYYLKKIDEKLYDKIRKEDWAKDLCSQFSTYCHYERLGLGFVVLYQDEIVSGASSYSVYDSGIEIEIDTRKEYQRKGLALACASALILECLKTGRYPSWDAANPGSVALSEKLGYHFDREYLTYAVTVN